MAFFGIYHPTKKKNPDPGDKNPRDISKIKNTEKIPKLRKIPNPEIQKIPNPGDKNSETQS